MQYAQVSNYEIKHLHLQVEKGVYIDKLLPFRRFYFSFYEKILLVQHLY